MNTLVKHLGLLCTEHLLQEKLLLVPHKAAGNSLTEQLLLAGQSWLNLKIATPTDLALEYAEKNLHEQGMSLASKYQLLAQLDKVLAHLDASHELTYFGPLMRNADLASLLLPAINELSYANTTCLNPAHFVTPRKGYEMSLIYKLFKQGLQESGFIEEGQLFALASLQVALGRGAQRIHLLPEPQHAWGAKMHFLNALPNLYILPCDKPLGLDTTVLPFRSNTVPAATSPLTCLYAVDQSDHKDLDLELWQANGEVAECREVLRKIESKGLPYDQVAIVCAQPALYSPIFYALAKSLYIPMTFSQGLALTHSRPGLLLRGLLDFARSGYEMQHLIALLLSKAVNLRLAERKLLLRALRLYPPSTKLTNHHGISAEIAKNLNRAEVSAKQAKCMEQASQFIQDVVASMPREDTRNIDFNAFCVWLVGLLGKYAPRRTIEDRTIRKLVMQKMTDIGSRDALPMSIDEAVARIAKDLRKTSVARSQAKPGALHVTSYENALWSSRQHTYVVGLDDAFMLHKNSQDPFLLDIERAAVDPSMPQSDTLSQVKDLLLCTMLAGLRGHISLSFSSFNAASGRENEPSPIFLQAYRLQQRRAAIDYSEMMSFLAPKAGYLSRKNPLSVDEWWATESLHGRRDGDVTAVQECYPNIARGLKARAERSSPDFTCFDGAVTPPEPSSEPYSVTKLQMLAECPFKYFLHYILRVRAIKDEDTVKRKSSWLDAAEKGTFLHSVFAKYNSSLQYAGNVHCRDRLLSIGETELKDWQRRKPPANDLLLAQFRQELTRDLDYFYADACESGPPKYVELSFGSTYSQKASKAAGQTEPLLLKLPSGKMLNLAGTIDRVDEVSPGEYHIWDYKTGRVRHTSDTTLAQGTRIQHELYAWAFTEWQRATNSAIETRVTQSGYIYPTLTGEGKRQPFPYKGSETIAQLVEQLLSIVDTGAFCATANKESCKNCDYASVCEHGASDAGAIKIANLSNVALSAQRELRKYV